MSVLRRLRAFGLLTLIAGLAGCSGGTGTQPLFQQLGAAAVASVTAARAGRTAQTPALTRAVLDDIEGSYFEVVREREAITGYVQLAETRQDALPGTITHWRTEDGVALSLRAGMLVATHGLGGDLISASVNAAPGRIGPVSGGERALVVHSGDMRALRVALSCDLADLGPASVEIVGLRHAARHLRESCSEASGGTVTNDYWVDQKNGIIWQSRQWAGPHIGYLRFRRLTR